MIEVSARRKLNFLLQTHIMYGYCLGYTSQYSFYYNNYPLITLIFSRRMSNMRNIDGCGVEKIPRLAFREGSADLWGCRKEGNGETTFLHRRTPETYHSHFYEYETTTNPKK